MNDLKKAQTSWWVLGPENLKPRGKNLTFLLPEPDWKMVPQLTLIFVTKIQKPHGAKTNIFVTRTQPEPEKKYPNKSLPKPEEIRFERFF